MAKKRGAAAAKEHAAQEADENACANIPAAEGKGRLSGPGLLQRVEDA